MAKDANSERWLGVLIGLGALAVALLLFGTTHWRSLMIANREALPIAESASCQGGKSCEIKDLPAQVRAANAAEDMADIAFWQLVASISGYIFVVLTLVFNVRGTSAAAAAAEASIKAVEIAQDTARRQLRAYIQVTALALPDPVIRSSGWTVSVNVKNVGQTPARNVRYSGVLIYVLSGSNFDTIDIEAMQPHSATIHPDAVLQYKTTSEFSLSMPWSDPIHGDASVFLSAAVKYLDIYDEEHVTQVCLRFLPGSLVPTTYQQGNMDT